MLLLSVGQIETLIHTVTCELANISPCQTYSPYHKCESFKVLKITQVII